ncbi:hypothetical protein [Polyangium aurulentum]|uniref:hypothetical protein n=1 Tax=Polyangium aurulentum TaxID=2567896 RepID=UPI00146A1252|nr:hypothetical protein [Polyangium aurulentum]UQA59082.1 hypothetical protein E8A73_000770 [Polyangium aurulentum]
MNIKRAWMIPLFLGAIAAGMAACGDGGGTPTSGGNPSGTGPGGAGGAGGAGGNGGGGGELPECMEKADCTGSDTFCGEVTCTNGTCGVNPLQPAGTVLPSQLYGDCSEKQCDAMGAVVSAPKDDDAYNDGNECTVEMCAGGMLMQTAKAQGEACAGGVCDGAGKCVGCLSDAECGLNKCIEGKCVPETCGNMMKDLTETDVDCGGPACAPCADGLLCSVSTHCKSGVCTSVGGAPKTCQPATCMDAKINGNETDEDCGGDCPPCSDNLACVMANDCASKVCVNNLCAAPSCTDAVQNGDETGTDCGGACMNACP